MDNRNNITLEYIIMVLVMVIIAAAVYLIVFNT